MRAFTLTLAFFLVALGSGVSAWAQGSSSIPAPSVDRSFDVQLFHPAVGPKSYVTLDSADVPGHLLYNLGLLTNYQYSAFALDTTANNRTTRLDVARHQAVAELFGAVGLFNLFEFGVALPMTLYLSGDDFDSTGQGTGAQIHAHGIGDVRVEAKAAPLAFGPDQAFVFGISAGVTFPTGGSANFLGDKTVTGRGRALLEYQSSERFRTVVMLGALLREKSNVLGAVTGDQVLYGAAVDFRVLPDMSVLAEFNGRVGSWTYVDANPAELDVAMRGYLPRMFSLLLGVGLGVNHGIGSPMIRGFLGLGWAPDFRDRDHDGIIDIFDRCPDEPEDKDGFQDDDGCPDEDNDNDGIPDAVDKCPNQPEDFDGFQDDDGCPDPDNDHDGIPDVDDACPNDPEDGKGKRPYDGCPSTLEDSDGDGIPDVKDQCPDEPEDKDGFQDEDGCPDPDNDNDGVPDIYDGCPNDPEDMDGFEDNDGCPDLDNDKDGIPDKHDKCPNQPETLNGYKDDDGCPDPGAPIVVLREDKIDIIERITFLPGQTDLSPQGLSIVKLVAMVMRGHTELARVRIDVRADGVTEATMQGRAQQVAKVLAAHGVDAKRLKIGNVSSGAGRVQFIIESRVAPKSIKSPFPATPLPPPPETPSPQAP
jgi:outer membrane protein OmpA-like peptidoglycan-associated protein